jgi:accessory gene regulator B
MLRLISLKCTDLLIKKEPSIEQKRNIYIYGFELFLSNIICIFSILLVGSYLAKIELSLLFLLYFMPIRIVAGGYHCKSYLNCYMLTNVIAMGSILLSKFLLVINFNEYVIYIIYLIAVSYIWRHASFSKYYQTNNIKKKCFQYSHYILIIETIIMLTIRCFYVDSKIYLAVITTVVVAFMINIQKRGENINE